VTAAADVAVRWGVVTEGATTTTMALAPFVLTVADARRRTTTTTMIPSYCRRIVFTGAGVLCRSGGLGIVVAAVARLRFPGNVRSVLDELNRFTLRWPAFRPYMTDHPVALVRVLIDESDATHGVAVQVTWPPLPPMSLKFRKRRRPYFFSIRARGTLTKKCPKWSATLVWAVTTNPTWRSR
jgi:hypothetical protein